MRRWSFLPATRLTATASIGRFYDRAAQGWQAGIDRIGYDKAYERLAAASLEYHPLTGIPRILDAGTGTGALARALALKARFAMQFDLLDLSPEMLARAKAHVPGRSRLIAGPLGDGSVAENHYDRVLCGHVIEHCDSPCAALAWLFGRLRPGGTAVFAISQPHWCTALVRWKYGSAAYRPEVVEEMLEQTGFTRIERRPHASGPPSRISCGYLATRPA